MSSRDMIVDRNLSPDEICRGLSQTLEILPLEILAVEEIYDSPVVDSTRVLCHFQDVDGDFSQIISVYIKDASVSDSSDERVGMFCEICSCTCLIDSLDENPLVMVFVKGVNQFETVHLSPNVINDDKYVIEQGSQWRG